MNLRFFYFSKLFLSGSLVSVPSIGLELCVNKSALSQEFKSYININKYLSLVVLVFIPCVGGGGGGGGGSTGDGGGGLLLSVVRCGRFCVGGAFHQGHIVSEGGALLPRVFLAEWRTRPCPRPLLSHWTKNLWRRYYTTTAF